MENDNLKLSEDGKTLIRVKDDSITHVVIPEGVTTTGKYNYIIMAHLKPFVKHYKSV